MSELAESNAINQGDVALLVDWENLKFSLAQRERRPNVSALRGAAERFGRIVYARAYADWQDPVHSGDPASLYIAGLEPVYVLTKRYTEASGEVRIKNSVDIKLAADCIEASHQYPNVQTYIIVTGDHGFLHVVNTLRPHGKRVVVIGVSWTTATQLTEQADVVLYYDVHVEPALGERPALPAPSAAHKKLPPAIGASAESAIRILEAQGNASGLEATKVAEILELILVIAHEFREAKRDFSVSLLGAELQKRLPPLDFARIARGRARAFVQALQQHGLLQLVSRDFVDWILLSNEAVEAIPNRTAAAYEPPRYDYAGFVWSDLDERLQDDCIQKISDERHRPNVDFLTFNRIRDLLTPLTGRDEYAIKNLVNNMVAVAVLRFDQERQGRDPSTGTPYSFNTVALDLQHPDVRRALKLG